MGMYIQTPFAKGKADYLISKYGAEEIELSDVPRNGVMVCVVDNGRFEAAAIAYDQDEIYAFATPDGRPKRWLLMAAGVVASLNSEYAEYLAKART